MISASCYPEEARYILQKCRLLSEDRLIEHLLGQWLVMRFDMLASAVSDAELLKTSIEQGWMVGDNGLESLPPKNYVLESIVVSTRIVNIIISSYVAEERCRRFSCEKDLLDFFQFRFLVDMKEFSGYYIDHLTLIEGRLCLAVHSYEPSADTEDGLKAVFQTIAISEYYLV